MTADQEWLHEELGYVNFGDERLDRRFKIMMDDFLKSPAAPINQASASIAKAKAAYRFFQNPLVTPNRILASHHVRTCERASSQKIVLNVQDTTSANYFDHPATEDLGHIGSARMRPDSKGLFVHTSFLVSAAGMPLGLIDQKIWSRREVNHGQSRNDRKIRLRKTKLRQKESQRWLAMMQTARSGIKSEVCVVNVADREADFYEFMRDCLATGSSFIVRAKSERRIEAEGEDEDDEITLLSEAFATAKALGERVITVRGNGKRSERLAKVVLYSRKISILPPRDLAAQVEGLEPLEVTAIWASEINASPKREGRISWLLLTDLETTDLESVVEKVQWYSYRWRIEEFHKILKSGCSIEECRLETADRLENYITSMSIIAYRLCELTYAQRQDPNAPASVVLSNDEWRCLYVRTHKGEKPPPSPPTLREATRWIAQLGGFLGRKGDGDPGIVTLWRGWVVFSESVATWIAFKESGLMTCG